MLQWALAGMAWACLPSALAGRHGAGSQRPACIYTDGQCPHRSCARLGSQTSAVRSSRRAGMCSVPGLAPRSVHERQEGSRICHGHCHGLRSAVASTQSAQRVSLASKLYCCDALPLKHCRISDQTRRMTSVTTLTISRIGLAARWPQLTAYQQNSEQHVRHPAPCNAGRHVAPTCACIEHIISMRKICRE